MRVSLEVGDPFPEISNYINCLSARFDWVLYLRVRQSEQPGHRRYFERPLDLSFSAITWCIGDNPNRCILSLILVMVSLKAEHFMTRCWSLAGLVRMLELVKAGGWVGYIEGQGRRFV